VSDLNAAALQAELDQRRARLRDLEAGIAEAPQDTAVANAQELDRERRLVGQLETALPFAGTTDEDLAERVLDLKIAMEERAEQLGQFPSDSGRGIKAQRAHDAARLEWAQAETEVRRRAEFASLTSAAMKAAAGKARHEVEQARNRHLASVAHEIEAGRDEQWRFGEAQSHWDVQLVDLLADQTRKAYRELLAGAVPDSLIREP
jgi:hypothetical protein